MSYILKNTSGLINTRLTDTARQKMSQGKFNISYFQVGDSEVSYNALPSSYNQMNTNIFEPNFNSQNSAGAPQSNKQNIKYPYFVDIDSNNTYGIPFMSSIVSPVYNSAPLRGFFSGNTDLNPISWSALTNNQYAINSNYIVNMSSLVGTNQISLIYNECNSHVVRQPAVGDLITIYYDGNGENNCNCYNVTTTTTTSQCWLTGFTLTTPIDGETPVDIPFINTGKEKNGFPVFTSIVSISTNILIYFDGDNWIISLPPDINNIILSGLTTNSPIGNFSFFNGDYIQTGKTSCDFNTICLEYTLDGTKQIQIQSFAYAEIGGDETYLFTGGDFIEYTASTDTWGLYLNSEDDIKATLSGLSPTGTWNSILPSYTNITTTFGLCDNEYPFSCSCVTFSASTDSPTSSLYYIDCNYEYQELTLISGQTQNICVILPINLHEYFYIPEGDFSFKICNDTCPQIITSNLLTTDPCNPTTTTTTTECPITTTTTTCGPPQQPNCTMSMSSCYPILTYRIVDICLDVITLDRKTPDFSYLSSDCYARTIVYPPNMTTIYDSVTPLPHWDIDAINYETVCDIDQFDVKVWNMNIPWSENPAGLFSNIDKDYTEFGSINYLGTKEYLGYASNSGQTFGNSTNQITATTDTFYYNSFDEKIYLEPEEQKAIAIIHYTNQTIDLFYGEKFALEPFDEENPGETGQARNFKLHIPWLMWHKNPDCCHGQTFWVDPPGDEFESLNLFKVHYIYSNKNNDMNNPGIRYYHLWDNNPNSIDGYPNRVGKVFPDQKIIVIDDEELIAALSYKSNRNWTLPSPKVSLITPNTCGNDNNSQVGILTDNTEYLYVTYRLSNTDVFTNSLHCNYYSVIQGPNTSCNPISSQNVSVRFGPEFNCLNNINAQPCWLNGFRISLECIENCEGGGDIGPNIIFNTFAYPTGTELNGFPVYAGFLFQFNIYFDGNSWIIETFYNGKFANLGETPLGSFTAITENDLSQTVEYRIINECGSNLDLCFSLTSGETTFNGVGIYVETDLGSVYSLGSKGLGDVILFYSASTSTWVVSGDTILATLFDPNQSLPPISNDWQVYPPISEFTTSSGSLDCYTSFCNCTSVTLTQLDPLTASTTLNYFNCNGLIVEEPISLNVPKDICVFSDTFNIVVTTEVTTLSFSSETCDTICTPVTSDFSYYTLTTTTTCPTTCNINTGFIANKFEIIVQKVTGTERPNSSDWKIIDFTDQISNYLVDGYLTQEILTATTFVITQELYDNANSYYLNDYIDLTPVGNTDAQLNFGDEYYFYGSIETDIQSTIYEMRYKVNLSQAEFQKSSNPTWKSGEQTYISEIALYDNEKDLMIISKLQSPVLRQGTQQFLIKFDF